MGRRDFLTRCAAGLGAATAFRAAAGAAEAAPAGWGPGPFSGMPWRTGYCGVYPEGLEKYKAWLGRPFDAVTLFTGGTNAKISANWESITGGPAGKPEVFLPDNQSTFPTKSGQLVTALGLPKGIKITWSLRSVPASNRSTQDKTVFKDIAAGKYDAYWITLGQRIKNFWEQHDRSLEDLTIRLSWEFNQSNFDQVFDGTKNGMPDSRPWFRDAFRRYVDGVRKGADYPIKFDLPLGRTYRIGEISSFYPGNDWVDVVSISHHDNDPAVASQKDWDAHWFGVELRYGLKEVFDFAVAQGKAFGLTEWGVVPEGSKNHKPSVNPAMFLRKTFEFLCENKDWIAYETYFQKDLLIEGGEVWEEGRRTYKELWGNPSMAAKA